MTEDWSNDRNEFNVFTVLLSNKCWLGEHNETSKIIKNLTGPKLLNFSFGCSVLLFILKGSHMSSKYHVIYSPPIIPDSPFIFHKSRNDQKKKITYSVCFCNIFMLFLVSLKVSTWHLFCEVIRWSVIQVWKNLMVWVNRCRQSRQNLHFFEWIISLIGYPELSAALESLSWDRCPCSTWLQWWRP